MNAKTPVKSNMYEITYSMQDEQPYFTVDSKKFFLFGLLIYGIHYQLAHLLSIHCSSI